MTLHNLFTLAPAMADTSIIRRALQLAEKQGMQKTEFADAIRAKPSDISNWQRRGMPPKYHQAVANALGISVDELLAGRDSSSLVMPLGRGIAQDVSHLKAIVALRTMEWSDIMNNKDLPEAFSLVLQDDAMAPFLSKGGTCRFSTTRKPVPGKPVLIADSDGNAYVREYKPRRGTQWAAVAANPAYQPLDSEVDGLKVLAVMTGWDWPTE